MRQRSIQIRLRCFFSQESIFLTRIVRVSNGIVLSIMVNVLYLVNFFNILVFEHESVQNNVVINLRLINVVGCMLF